MTPEQYQLATRLFLRACDVAADQRESYLLEACSGDAESLNAVRFMLAQDQRPLPVSIDALLVGIHASGAASRDGELTDRGQGAARAGERFVGRFRLLRQIGAGGMGVVYLAEQDQPRREVALKLIRPGFFSPQIMCRFQHEANILAKLSHPGIAQVYEAGVADVPLREWQMDASLHQREPEVATHPTQCVDNGSMARCDETVRIPFFAMELVCGESIDRFVRSRQLGTAQQLQMIAAVCDAVQHAHDKGIIHRDLKPANILVVDNPSRTATAPFDGAGTSSWIPSRPKILDFGVARATGSDVNAVTVQTAVGELVGTLSYMSPEQIAGNPDDLDARSDVYALGLIMCELLTGRLPYDLSGCSIAEVGRIIREQEPSWLHSDSVSARRSPSDQVGHEAADDPSPRRVRLDRDVRTIIGKALEKDRMRRYGSAGDLATDILRCLRHEPIAARPPSTLYQFRKFAQRHKGLVAGTMAAFSILAAALIVVSIQRIRIEREANLARETSAFLETLLQAADPYPLHHGTSVPRNFGVGARFVDVLDDAVQRLQAYPLTSPEAEATVRYRLGMSYYGLGRYEQGVAMLERAIAIRREIFGGTHPRTLECQVALVWNRTMLLDSLDAERLARQTVDAYVQRVGWSHEETIKAMGALAISQMYAGFIRDAAATAEEMCQLIEANQEDVRFTPLLPRLLIADLNVREFNRVEDGRAMAEQALRAAETGLEATTNVPGYCKVILGRAARATGNVVEAERLMRDGIEIWAAIAQTQALSEMRGELATMIAQQPGRQEEGLAMWREVIDNHCEAFGPNSPLTFSLMAKHAAALHATGRTNDAEQQYRSCVQQWILSGRHPAVPRQVVVMYQFGSLLRDRGELKDAESILRSAIELADQFDEQVWKRSSFDRTRIGKELNRLIEQ